jgi:MoaA/NifB/PqqE/SkfB family radical SAM enzyme
MNILKEINYLHKSWNININKSDEKVEITIRIIKSCNEKCIFCSTDLDNSIIEYRKLISIVLFFIKFYKKNIYFAFSWGEPTIYDGLENIISFVINKWFNVKIETNAVNFSNLEFIEKYKNYKWKITFFVSFHAHNKELYKKITKTNLFDKSFLWIKNLYKYFWSESITLNCVINSINFLYLEDYLIFIDTSFIKDKKINLSFSILLANKKWYSDLTVKYSEIILFFNKLNNNYKNFNIIEIFNSAWWYTQLPFCLFSKLKFINNSELFSKIIFLDKFVGSSIMHKWDVCKKCKFSEYCLWISKWYYEKYWDTELFSI